MSLARVQITVERTREVFRLNYNPEEYTLNQDNNFANQAVPGLSAPQLQYVHGNMRTLEMELMFDTYDSDKLPKDDVRDQTNRLLKLMQIDPELHAPPVLVVEWGSLAFRCVLARASQKFILFSDDGKPVRARVNCTFNEYVDLEREAREINRQTADFTKLHVVKGGQTLSSIAAERYNDPQRWRAIAIANDIDDPRALDVGASLIIPSLPFVDPASGEAV